MAGWTMSDLPFSWTVTELSNVGTWGSGGTPSRSNANNFLGDIPWAIIGDLNDDVLRSTQQKISKIGLSTSSAKLVPEKALLVAMYGSIGKLSITGIECATNQAIAFCIPDEDLIDLKYLFYALRYSRAKLIDLGQGAGQQNISQTILKSFEIPIAPLKEQQCIAQKLDALLAQVDTLKARIDAIPALLTRFRESVLNAAVNGVLTESWRLSHLGSTDPNWRSTTFSEICTEITVGYVGKMADRYQTNGIPFLRSQNVRPFRFAPENLLYISPEFHSTIIKSQLKPGDLAIVRSGAPGVACVIPATLSVANCSDLVIARPSKDLTPKFGCIFMNSEVGKRAVAEKQVGVAQQHFNVGSMKKLQIRLPSIEEQTEIARRVEQLFALADQLEAKLSASQKRIDALTQSLLAKAFRGELVPQDPNDEPASALLERIRAQRAAAPKPKRGRKAAAS